jgi:predicted dehydrogenase
VAGAIGVGVIGMGPRGRYLARGLREHPSARVVALCDTDPARLRSAAEGLASPGLGEYRTSAELLADRRVDAVVVATHDKAHAAVGLEVLRARKHLFLEKPMAQTIEDCDELIAAWRRAGTVFMVGLELRYCSLAEDMKAILDRGEIGDVRLGYAVDNVSVGGQYYFHDASRRKEHVVNLVLQKGIHTIDLMNWWIASEPVRVYAEAGLDVFGGAEPDDKRCRSCDRASSCPYAMPRELRLDYEATAVDRDDRCVWAEGVDVEDNTIVTVRYANGAKMTYVECHFAPDYNRRFTLYGTRGRMDGFYDNEQNFSIDLAFRHTGRRESLRPERRPGGHGGGDPRIRDEFVSRVLAGRPACPGVAGARSSAAIAIAAGIAVDTGSPVPIPPSPLASEAGELP